MLRRSLALLALVAIPATGCTKVTMVDNVEFDLQWFVPFTGPSNDLHSPYVAGAGIKLYADSTNSSEDMTGWTFQTSDPSVFAIQDQAVSAVGHEKQLSADAVAMSAGSATLRIVDIDGKERAAQTVEVKVPDQAAVLAHGPLIIGHPDGDARTTGPAILAGGTATFLVKWYAGGQELSGNGVLSLQAPADVTATAETTAFLVNREWLQVTAPATPGQRTVALFADGHQVTTLPIDVVDPSAIDHLRLEGQNESGVSDGSWLVVLAGAFDAGGRPIYGVEYSFDVDGTAQSGMGDLYRYQFKAGTPHMLTASSAGQTAQATIHSGMGYVDSTNNVGCSATGARGGMGTVLCVGLALLGMRLRRRRAAR